MTQQIIELAIKNGLWAVLFTFLLIYVLKDSSKREKKYQKTIVDLTDHLGIVRDIKKEVEIVKDYVYNKTKKVKQKEENKSEKNDVITQN